MKKRVEVVDDTQRHNVMVRVTPEMRTKNAIPIHVFALPAVDKFGRRVQKPVRSVHVYEGAHLEHAVRRAKRWIRNKWSPQSPKAPRHIFLAMAAFHKADPLQFRTLLAEKACRSPTS